MKSVFFYFNFSMHNDLCFLNSFLLLTKTYGIILNDKAEVKFSLRFNDTIGRYKRYIQRMTASKPYPVHRSSTMTSETDQLRIFSYDLYIVIGTYSWNPLSLDL